MKIDPRLDAHARGVQSHGPVPLAQHADYLEANLTVAAEHLLPVGRELLSSTATTKEVEQGVSNEETAYRRVRARVLKDVLHVAQVGGAVVVRGFAVVAVENIHDGVAQARKAEFAAHDIDVETGDTERLGICSCHVSVLDDR
jgi:hypothetical protein